MLRKKWFKLAGRLVTVTITLVVSAVDETRGDEKSLREDAKGHFQSITPIPESALTDPRVVLGQELFWDKRVSSNGKIACASCHPAEFGGADERRFSVDAREKETNRNSQTVFNATLQPKLRWTADRDSAAHQAERSLTGSLGFTSAEDVLPVLKTLGYEKKFASAFSDTPSMTPQNYAKAIEVYEQTLITPSPWDRFLNGDDNAISETAKRGLRLFIDRGCVQCHDGRLLGGESMEKFGVVKDYWTVTKSEKHDAGKFESTKNEDDRFVFRVSMLRNISRTGPYFHDGSVKSLKEAIQVMSDVQLGSRFEEDDAAAIETFLECLSGDVPPNYHPPGIPDR